MPVSFKAAIAGLGSTILSSLVGAIPTTTAAHEVDSTIATAPPSITARQEGLFDGALGAADSIVEGLAGDVSELGQVASAYAAVITAQTATAVAPSEPSEVISIVSNILQPSGISAAVSDALASLDDALGPDGKIAQGSGSDSDLPAVPSGADNSPLNSPGGTSVLDVAFQFITDGIDLGSKANIFVEGQLAGTVNSFVNNNAKEPATPVYASKDASDPAYDVPESQLRNAIHNPSDFTYGQKPPVILVPGTGTTGGDNFAGNMIPLLTDVDYADIVWLNIPGFMLGDIQNNAEYIAYAINYISSVSNNANVSLITWSQGGLASQRALKYWPSTRKVVSNLIATSPDYHGTVQAYFLNPAFPRLPNDPSILQQTANSNFIATLLASGGDSAYVPTTNIYSSFFDEIVQPQTGTQASAFLQGASNNELQTLCPGLPAGSFYTHEGVLYNPVTFGLVKDALVNGGPAQAGRIGLDALCPLFVTQGLDVEDVLSTEATIPQAGVNLLLFEPKMLQEPAIKNYAA
ncbi:MAG: hypothetical protein Q9159_005233 [Coniocarpon cinnabarinum]